MNTDGQAADPGASSGNHSQASGEGAGDAGKTLVTELAQAQPGSGALASSTQGAQDGQAGSGEGAAQAVTEPKLPGYAAGLTGSFKSKPEVVAYVSKFKSLDDQTTAAMELEKKMGGMVAYPNEKSTPEEIAAFWSKAGVPSKPDEYKLDRIQGLPYDDTQENELRKFFHENHVPQAAASALYKMMGERMAQEIAAFTAKKDEIKAATMAQLQKEQGQNYDGFLTAFRQGLAMYATPALMEKLEKSGFGNDYDVIQLFANIGSLVKEDTAAQRGGAPAGHISDAKVLFGESSK
jgi:hypothetical protein